MPYCKKCNAKIKIYEDYCHNCGTKFRSTTWESILHRKVVWKRHRNFIIGAIIFFLLIIFSIFEHVPTYSQESYIEKVPYFSDMEEVTGEKCQDEFILAQTRFEDVVIFDNGLHLKVTCWVYNPDEYDGRFNVTATIFDDYNTVVHSVSYDTLIKSEEEKHFPIVFRSDELRHRFENDSILVGFKTFDEEGAGKLGYSCSIKPLSQVKVCKETTELIKVQKHYDIVRYRQAMKYERLIVYVYKLILDKNN